MSSAIATRDDTSAIAITQEERELIRKTYGKQLNDLEFQLFLKESEHRGLDILKGEIKAIKFGDVVSFFPSVHGIIKLAGRQGSFDGMEGPYFYGKECGWVEFWTDDKNPPAAAKTIVYRKDRSRPTVGIAVWNERKQTYTRNNQQVLMPMWAKMPAHMLGKVSVTDALKRSGLVGDEPVWIEDDDTVDGMNVRVVENQRDTANRRLHGAVAKAGLGGHPEARALAAQVRPGITSLTDPELTPSDMHAAADIAENLDHDYVEGLIEGEIVLADGPEAPTNLGADDDCDRALWREQIQDALNGDFKTLSPQLVSYAKVEPWRFVDLIELAPAEKYVTAYKNAAQTAGADPDAIYRAILLNRERKQIGEEVKKSADSASVVVKDWNDFWAALKRRNVGAGDFESLVGKKSGEFDSPQAALDALNEAEAAIPVSEQGLPGFDEMRDPRRFTA